MKKGKMIWMAVIAALVLIPAMAWGQATISTRGLPATEPSFFVEGYVGGGAASNSGGVLNGISVPGAGLNITTATQGQINPYFLGGLKFGYWFTPQGTYAASWYTDWMKYLGFFTDFSYQSLRFGSQGATLTAGAASVNSNFSTNGNLVSWAFMFAGRYGFLPDSEVPFGRLQPYVAVGPCLFFLDQNPTVNIPVAGVSISPGNKSSFDVGLAAELGLRYFVNKSISLDASFKYRYFSPSETFAGNIGGLGYTANSNPDMNLFSGQFGVAYHF